MLARILLLTIFALLAMSRIATGQTFTFQCLNTYLTPPVCDICTGTIESRSLKGLLVRKNNVPFKWIDEPYSVRLFDSVLTIRELLPNPDQVLVHLKSTPYTSLAQFMDSVLCSKAKVIEGGAWFVSDLTRAKSILPEDTLKIVGTGSITVTLDTTTRTLTINGSGGGGGGNQSLSAAGSGPTIYSINLSPGGTKVIIREGVGIDITRQGDTLTYTNSAPNTTVALTPGAGISVTGAYPNFTITALDVSATNEGLLGVGAGASNTATLLSNTSGQTPVVIQAGTGVTITETPSSNGGTIVISSTGGGSTSIAAGPGIIVTGSSPNFTVTAVDTSISNEGLLGVGAGTSTSATLLSNTSGQVPVSLTAGTGITITESTSSNGGSITIANVLGATDKNGYYGGNLGNGGNGTIPSSTTSTITNTLTFSASDNAGGKIPFRILVSGNEPEFWVAKDETTGDSLYLGHSDVEFFMRSGSPIVVNSTTSDVVLSSAATGRNALEGGYTRIAHDASGGGLSGKVAIIENLNGSNQKARLGFSVGFPQALEGFSEYDQNTNTFRIGNTSPLSTASTRVAVGGEASDVAFFTPIGAGFKVASVSGVHSTVTSNGSIAAAYLSTLGSPTIDDTKFCIRYTGSTAQTFTLPTPSECPGRLYWFINASAQTITFSQGISNATGTSFTTLSSAQQCFIISTGSGWVGFRLTSD